MVTAHPLTAGLHSAVHFLPLQVGEPALILIWTAAGTVTAYLGLVTLIGMIAWRTHVRGDIERNIRIMEMLVRVLPWRTGQAPGKRPQVPQARPQAQARAQAQARPQAQTQPRARARARKRRG
ncbi:hypothetical protein [Actinomadura rupiterrae]|uniref:hypothetical protein n=1 Tax=Actinomadura rupiterrae TaxID=559627 RepID=UPI0020A4A6EA|nr:hypothetical protein [Actinomadura rupiterrae]MCP2336109.1 hypothetical protein [Actinomadura rupiterrae]